jgi:hypothetical protein
MPSLDRVIAYSPTLAKLKMPGASRLLKEPLDRSSLWTPSKNF